MKWNLNQRLLGVAAVIVVLGALAACSSDDGGDAPSGGEESGGQPVTLVLDWTPNTNHAGIYVAQAEGYYDEAGLDVEIIQPGESGSLPALGSGQADFALTVQEQLIPARAEDVPAVAVAAVLQHNTSSLVALGEEGIESPADLVGKRYGGFGGQLETELVQSLVACDGGDPTGVEFVEVGNVDYRVGLEQDFYDFVWIFDGWDGIRLGEVEGVDVTTLPFRDYEDCIPDWYTPMIATTEELVADDPDTVAAFVEATARGYEYAIGHPDEAAAILLEAAPELDADLVEASMAYLADQFLADAPQWGWQEEQVWVDFEAFLRRSGLVTEQIDVADAFTNEFLPEPDATG
jgi:ABC-type nitrate/sulfonate/bicarbonate transport system substrate-binding protein